MSRRGRRNWSNLEINKRICKHLILHRIWNRLSQGDLAMDIGTTFQQYQKVEKCYNRIFAEQLISICNNRHWDISIFNSDPYETLKEWFIRDYGDNSVTPDKYHKIKRFWEVLDKSAARNYYGDMSDAEKIMNIEKGN